MGLRAKVRRRKKEQETMWAEFTMRETIRREASNI